MPAKVLLCPVSFNFQGLFLQEYLSWFRDLVFYTATDASQTSEPRNGETISILHLGKSIWFP